MEAMLDLIKLSPEVQGFEVVGSGSPGVSSRGVQIWATSGQDSKVRSRVRVGLKRSVACVEKPESSANWFISPSAF